MSNAYSISHRDRPRPAAAAPAAVVAPAYAASQLRRGKLSAGRPPGFRSRGTSEFLLAQHPQDATPPRKRARRGPRMSRGMLGPSISCSPARTRSPSCTFTCTPRGSAYSRGSVPSSGDDQLALTLDQAAVLRDAVDRGDAAQSTVIRVAAMVPVMVPRGGVSNSCPAVGEARYAVPETTPV